MVCHGRCRWTRAAWGRRARTGRAPPRRSSTPPPTSWVRLCAVVQCCCCCGRMLEWYWHAAASGCHGCCAQAALQCSALRTAAMLTLPGSLALPPPTSSPCLPAVFQQLEVDYTFAGPHPTYYPTDLREVTACGCASWQPQEQQAEHVLCRGPGCACACKPLPPAVRRCCPCCPFSRNHHHVPSGARGAHVRRDRGRLLRLRLCARL